jgi:hypothetical protein
MVIRSPAYRHDIPVDNGFTSRLDIGASADSDARLNKAVAGQSPPFYPCFKKNKGAATNGSYGLVAFNEMADDLDAAIYIPDMLRGPTSWQQQTVEGGGINLVEGSIRVHRVPRPLNVGMPALLLLMNNNMNTLLFGRGNGYIKAFFSHAENRMIQIRRGTIPGYY